MKKIDLGQTIAILANLGVIASLIFVGVQVQQGALATRSATVLQLKDSWVQLNLASATSVELAEAFRSVETQGWNDADYIAKELVASFYRALFHNWSNAYYQYRNGTLDEDQWAPHLREAEASVQKPGMRDIWSGWGYVYDDPFRNLMDDLIAQSAGESN